MTAGRIAEVGCIDPDIRSETLFSHTACDDFESGVLTPTPARDPDLLCSRDCHTLPCPLLHCEILTNGRSGENNSAYQRSLARPFPGLEEILTVL
jgi:hypothetical protein